MSLDRGQDATPGQATHELHACRERAAQLELENGTLRAELEALRTARASSLELPGRNLLQALMDNLPALIFFKDRESRFVLSNTAHVKNLGATSLDQIRGKDDLAFHSLDAAQTFIRDEQQILATGIPLLRQVEYNPAPDGTPRYFETSKFAWRDDSGTIVGTLGIAHEITDRILTEEKLKDEIAERKRAVSFLDAVIDNLPTMLFIKEAQDLRITRWNKAAEHLTGLTAQQAIGKSDYDFFPASQADFFVAKDRETLSGQSLVEIAQEPIESASHGLRYLHTKKIPILDETGRPAYLLGISEDITESIRAAKARERQAFQDALISAQFQVSPDGILVVGKDDRLLSYNQRFVEMWNMPPDALASGSVERLRQAVRENLADTETWSRQTGEIYARTDANSQDEVEFNDGRIFERYSTPIKNAQGEYQGRVWFFHDITAVRRGEQATLKQNAYLQALNETSLGLMQRLEVNSLLQDIVARAGALVGTENGYVFLLEPDKDEMQLRVGVGAYHEFVGRRTQRGTGLAGQVWESNAPVVVDDYRTWGGRLADPSRDILRAVAGVPLRSGAAVVGIIGLAYLDESRKFTDAEIQILQRFAQLAAIALDNALLYETARTELNERARAEAELDRQLQETELLNRVTGHAVSLDLNAALVEICREMAIYFRLEQSGVALLTEDRQSLRVVADYSPENVSSVVGFIIPIRGNPSTEIVLQTRRAAAFEDAQNDPRLALIHELMRARGVASILIVPLFVRDEIIGTLGLDSYEPRAFTERDIALVERIALSISTALENARLYRSAQLELAERTRAELEVRARNQELEVISRVSAVMTTDIDTVTALETLARELVTTFKARNCGIALLNPEKTELTVVADALAEEHEEHAVGIVIPMAGNLSSQYVVDNKRSLVIADAQTDPMTEPIHERMRQRQTKCLAIIPLLSGGDVIGTIGLDTTDPLHIFNEQEIRLAETMANQMANAIEKQRLFDQTKERARREQLTRQIGADMTRSLDMETIMQTVARELSRALGASHAVVRMGAPTLETQGALSAAAPNGQANGSPANGGSGDSHG